VDQLSGALFFIALFGYAAVESWLGRRDTRARQQNELESRKLKIEVQKMDLEAQKALLNKFQSPEELTEFFQTEIGKQFAERFKARTVAPAVSVNPLGGIMALIVFGALFVGLGLAFLILAEFIGRPAMFIPAFLLSIPGLGLLMGAALSYHLKKKWGLLKRDPPAPAG